jgi:hypothetical protein
MGSDKVKDAKTEKLVIIDLNSNEIKYILYEAKVLLRLILSKGIAWTIDDTKIC